MTIKVLVCGGRDYNDRRTLYRVLENIAHDVGIDCVVHGASNGADTLAGEWASGHGISRKVYPANWHRDGKAAGPIRNQKMLDEEEPDLVVAFPGGKGTADMVRRAEKSGIEVIKV